MLTLQRLNGDASWLLTSQTTGASLVIDPWLFGEQTDYFSWLSTQEHRKLALSPQHVLQTARGLEGIVVSLPFTDHCHGMRPAYLRAFSGGDGDRILALLPPLY
jgi:L-ascorbate metabolism protein UlaG (beta-lactamase superfamily)